MQLQAELDDLAAASVARSELEEQQQLRAWAEDALEAAQQQLTAAKEAGQTEAASLRAQARACCIVAVFSPQHQASSCKHFVRGSCLLRFS